LKSNTALSLLILVSFGLSFLLLFPASSQAQDQPPIVARISVLVDDRPGTGEIKSLLFVKEGELFSAKKVSDSIKQIFRTGLFSDVQVLSQGEANIELTFVLERKHIMQRIRFEGLTGIPIERLKERISALREGEFFSEEKLDRAVEELKDVLNDEGYFHPDIEASTSKDPQTSDIVVLFDIGSVDQYVVRDIDFTGEVIVPENDLKKKMDTKEGKNYVPELLNKDIEKLKDVYYGLDYQRAEIIVKERIFSEEEGSVSLVLEIQPREKIEVVIRGAYVPKNLLDPIWEMRIFEEWGLTEGQAKIINFMRKKGYLYSSVQSSIEREEDRIRVIYDIAPGRRYKILDVAFRGMEHFKSSELRKELGISEGLPILRNIDGARIFELPPEIEFFYKTRGFPNTQVSLNFETRRRRIRPVFFIDEGEQEKITSISFEGADLFDESRLLNEIDSTQGGPFFQPSIEHDIGKLESFYLDQGVRGTEIKAEAERVGENAFSIHFIIAEGILVKIENVIITGNQATKRKIIERESKIREGDLAYYSSIRETKRRLERLGIFTQVKIEEMSLSPDKENVLITVQEGDKNYASLGLGLETKNEPQLPAIWNNVVRLRGTAELIRNNMFGNAAQLSLVGQVSQREKRAVLSWEQPYLFGLELQPSLNIWIEREERTSYSFDGRGISLTSMRPVAKVENLVFITTLRVVRTTLFDLQIKESEVDRQQTPFSATSVSGSLIWDLRDDPVNAERGYFFSSALEWAFPLFGAESDFVKMFFKYQHFVPLWKNINFSATARVGLGRGMIPIHERFFAGGSNSFRGAEFDELGPKDSDSQNPVGGKALILFNFEVSFPLFRSLPDLLGVAFYDKGNVFAKRSQVSWASLEDTLGFGLRYRTPLGPIRFELGWNMTAPAGERKAHAFITIGHIF
jgi:outer membrane protein assembly complex protein YaeT